MACFPFRDGPALRDEFAGIVRGRVARKEFPPALGVCRVRDNPSTVNELSQDSKLDNAHISNSTAITVCQLVRSSLAVAPF